MNGCFFRGLCTLLCVVCLLGFLLTGCAPQLPEPTAYRVVVQIQILYQNSGLRQFWSFHSDEKMESILTYLRILDPYGTPEVDPESAPGSDFFITLIYSDGNRKCYQQRADRYLRIGNGTWRYIDPDTALRLSNLLGVLIADSPGAEEPPASSPPPLSDSVQ